MLSRILFDGVLGEYLDEVLAELRIFRLAVQAAADRLGALDESQRVGLLKLSIVLLIVLHVALTCITPPLEGITGIS